MFCDVTLSFQTKLYGFIHISLNFLTVLIFSTLSGVAVTLLQFRLAIFGEGARF